jgi:hypothetical protein
MLVHSVHTPLEFPSMFIIVPMPPLYGQMAGLSFVVTPTDDDRTKVRVLQAKVRELQRQVGNQQHAAPRQATEAFQIGHLGQLGQMLFGQTHVLTNQVMQLNAASVEQHRLSLQAAAQHHAQAQSSLQMTHQQSLDQQRLLMQQQQQQSNAQQAAQAQQASLVLSAILANATSHR